MSELVWTCENGRTFSSEANGLRLLVERGTAGNGFRYRLIQRHDAAGDVPVASGHREDLRDAIEAAESHARGLARGRANPELARA